MGYKLVVTREAHADIDEITAYIAKKLRNPQAAASFLDKVEKSYRDIVKTRTYTPYAQTRDCETRATAELSSRTTLYSTAWSRAKTRFISFG